MWLDTRGLRVFGDELKNDVIGVTLYGCRDRFMLWFKCKVPALKLEDGTKIWLQNYIRY